VPRIILSVGNGPRARAESSVLISDAETEFAPEAIARENMSAELQIQYGKYAESVG